MFWLEKYGSMAPLLVALPPTPLIVSSSFPNLQAGRPTPPTLPFLLPNNPPTPLPSSDPQFPHPSGHPPCFSRPPVTVSSGVQS